MRTRIISAFPGTGKTTFVEENPDIALDSDSSKFSWCKGPDGLPTKERNPLFPENYIAHIKENIGKYEFIFVSTHKEVRDALLDNCLFFYLIYPDEGHKQDYLQRFAMRGNASAFVNLVAENWSNWLHELTFCGPGCKRIEMVFPYLEGEIEHIVRSENGER